MQRAEAGRRVRERREARDGGDAHAEEDLRVVHRPEEGIDRRVGVGVHAERRGRLRMKKVESKVRCGKSGVRHMGEMGGWAKAEREKKVRHGKSGCATYGRNGCGGRKLKKKKKVRYGKSGCATYGRNGCGGRKEKILKNKIKL